MCKLHLSIILSVVLIMSGQTNSTSAADEFVEQARDWTIEVVSENLEVPVAMTFLPDGRALLAERASGRLSILDVSTGETSQVSGLPEMALVGDGGLLDVVLHPDFAENGWIYLAYTVGNERQNTTSVGRGRLNGTELTDFEPLLSPELIGGKEHYTHYSGRLVVHNGYLYMSIGDRYGLQDQAQNNANLLGTIIRLHDDGRIPADNPFGGQANIKPEIWSYGHRNPQGLMLNPETNELWAHEHGPQGGDEINIIRPGRNYGWPVITWGEEYGGSPIGDGLTHKDGMEQPFHYFIPSIAPSDMIYYTGDAFPNWQGNIFIGALSMSHLNMLSVDETRVVRETRLLDANNWRVRMVEQGPDGYIYIGIDDGKVLRLVPRGQ